MTDLDRCPECGSEPDGNISFLWNCGYEENGHGFIMHPCPNKERRDDD